MFFVFVFYFPEQDLFQVSHSMKTFWGLFNSRTRMLTRCTFHVVMLSVCAGVSRSDALCGCKSFLQHLPLSFTQTHICTHTHSFICEKQNQHSCNNSSLSVLLSSLRCLHSIINQDSPPCLCSTFCPFSPSWTVPLLSSRVSTCTRLITVPLRAPDLTPQSPHSPHTITPILPSLSPSLSRCPSLSSQQLAEHVLPLERRASTA